MPENINDFFPDASVDALVRKGNESLFNTNPHVREVLIWEKKQDKNKNLFALVRKISGRKYDAVINLQRFFSTGFITMLSGAKEKIGFDKNPLSSFYTRKIKHVIDGRHEVDRNNELISHWGSPKLRRPIIYLTGNEEKAVEVYKKGDYVCMAPTSVWFTKQWPADKWIEAIKGLPESITCYLMGAKTDKEACDFIIEKSGRDNVINLCGKMNLLESAALMRDAKMNYVNDSAPMHLASAVNAPVAAIYCSTIPLFGFGPLSDDSHVIERHEPLSCRPCGLHGLKACPQGHFKCANSIETQRLLGLLK